ncbi:MAG: protein-tyrosine phosphatase [Maribacter sp.]|jgi:protein-tyrosine phosphatase
MGLFSIFGKKQQNINYSFLKTDMHSHLLPSIDDGSKSMEDSISMIKGLVNLGYEKIITTPHIMGDYYPNTPEIIRSKVAVLNQALNEQGVNIQIEAAAEYFLDGFFEELLENDVELLTFSDNCLLVEFSTFAMPANAFNLIFQLQTKGYKVILAHPERYVYLANQFEQFEQFKSQGCLFQANLLSLAGHYGSEQKKLGLKMLKAGMIDYLGTDLHRQGHLPKLGMIDKKIQKTYFKKGIFRNAEL